MTLRNRSIEFINKRRERHALAAKREQTEVEKGFERITREVSRISKSIGEVEEQCRIYCLPSFKSKRDSLGKIETLKYEVARDLARCKAAMQAFSEQHKSTMNPSLIDSIRRHFNYKLDDIIGRLNGTQVLVSENMGKVSVFETIDRAAEAVASHKASVHAEKQEYLQEEADEQESSKDIERIHKSIYFLSSIIKELRAVISSQSEKIERLDIVMDGISGHAQSTLKEVAAIPTLTSRLKNRLISILLLLILALVVLSIIKAQLVRPQIR